ncbi:exported protein [Staphylococcus aureus]|uniref:Exported protein n=1 Tax=Staphylococcus aureus TaxID=1280 RepID=A0A380E3F3_STAAU|nr:exported protein [Staphylococcus aureus]
MENKFVPGILIWCRNWWRNSLADKSTRQALVQSVKDAKNGNRTRSLLKSARLKTKFLYWKMLLKKFVVIILN